MNYKQITKQLKQVQFEMQNEIPRYWESRIDLMIDKMPASMIGKDLFLYVNQNIADIVGWFYRGVELLVVKPMPDDTIWLSRNNVFKIDFDFYGKE
jgi:hypothetical protein